jgi:hypothetical protein
MHQLELLKPTLRELARSNEGRKEDNPLGLVGLGNSQWLAIGSVIGAEYVYFRDISSFQTSDILRFQTKKLGGCAAQSGRADQPTCGSPAILVC